MKPATHPTACRTRSLLEAAGLETEVVEFETPTRSAQEAADAIGCDVAEIAKSILFRGKTSGTAIMVVACGDRRVSEKKVAALVGEALGRADADFVREATGYVIGGVAPIGHPAPVRLLLDANLQRFAHIWAAAGTPYSVFRLTPAELAQLTAAPWHEVHAD